MTVSVIKRIREMDASELEEHIDSLSARHYTIPLTPEEVEELKQAEQQLDELQGIFKRENTKEG